MNEVEVTSHNKELSFSKNFLVFIKEYGKFIYSAFFILIMIFDYLIYTDVFNLNHADFINYFLINILSQQLLIVFIILPFAITGLLMLVYMIQYKFFKRQKIKDYITSEKMLFRVWKYFFYFAISFLGEILFFVAFIKFLTFLKINIDINILTFTVAFFFIVTIINFSTFRLLTSFVRRLTDKIFFMNEEYNLYVLLAIFFVIKLLLLIFFYPIIYKYSKIDININLYILLNLILFMYTIVIFISYQFPANKENIKPTDINFLFFAIVMLVMGISTTWFFKQTEELYKAPYNKYSFWSKAIFYNGYISTNLSMSFNPMKITSYHDVKNIKNLFKDQNISVFLQGKEINTTIANDINNTINFLISNSEIESKKIFYLPNGDRKLLFVLPHDINSSDLNKTITLTVLHIKEDSKSSSLIDIGYINSQTK